MDATPDRQATEPAPGPAPGPARVESSSLTGEAAMLLARTQRAVDTAKCVAGSARAGGRDEIAMSWIAEFAAAEFSRWVEALHHPVPPNPPGQWSWPKAFPGWFDCTVRNIKMYARDHDFANETYLEAIHAIDSLDLLSSVGSPGQLDRLDSLAAIIRFDFPTHLVACDKIDRLVGGSRPLRILFITKILCNLTVRTCTRIVSVPQPEMSAAEAVASRAVSKTGGAYYYETIKCATPDEIALANIIFAAAIDAIGGLVGQTPDPRTAPAAYHNEVWTELGSQLSAALGLPMGSLASPSAGPSAGVPKIADAFRRRFIDAAGYGGGRHAISTVYQAANQTETESEHQTETESEHRTRAGDLLLECFACPEEYFDDEWIRGLESAGITYIVGIEETELDLPPIVL